MVWKFSALHHLPLLTLHDSTFQLLSIHPKNTTHRDKTTTADSASPPSRTSATTRSSSMEPLPSLPPLLPTRRPQHNAPQQHSRRRNPIAFTAAAIFLLSSSLPTSASSAYKSSRSPRRIGSQSAFLRAPPPPLSPLSSFSSSASSASSFPPYRHAPRPLAATPLPRNDKDKKAKGGGSTEPIKSRSGLAGAGLTREKAILGAVGGSLGVWGIATAAHDLQKAADKASSRAFVWKEPSEMAKKLEGGGLSGPGVSLTPQGVFSLAFVTYLARFLLNFDSSVANWWASEVLPTAPVSSSKGNEGSREGGREGRREGMKEVVVAFSLLHTPTQTLPPSLYPSSPSFFPSPQAPLPGSVF